MVFGVTNNGKCLFMKSKLIIVVIVSSLVIQSCLHTRSNTSTKEDSPQVFSLIFGEGGGITGRWQGFTVDTDGVISRWEGRVAGENAKAVGSLSRDELASIWKRSTELRQLASGVSKKGDLTYFILLTSNGSKNEYTWIADGSSSSKVLHDFHSYCRFVIEQKTKK